MSAARAAIAAVTSGLVLAGCGGAREPDDSARAARLAALARGLDQHAATVSEQGLAGPLRAACTRQLEVATDQPYYRGAAFDLSASDLRWVAEWQAGGADRQLEALASMASDLRGRDVELLVVPIPRVPQIYPERLAAGLTPPADFVGVDGELTRFLGRLVERGVDVLHLTPHFAAARTTAAPDEDPFLFHDRNHHWTPRAAALAADLVAERARELVGLDGGELVRGVDFEVIRERVPFQYKTVDPLPFETEVWVDAVRGFADEAAVLRDKHSPILLLGDSNSRWYEQRAASLPHQLVARLERPIDAVVLPAADPLSVWRTVLRREGPTALEHKRLVVWIFQAAELGEPALAPLELFPD